MSLTAGSIDPEAISIAGIRVRIYYGVPISCTRDCFVGNSNASFRNF